MIEKLHDIGAERALIGALMLVAHEPPASLLRRVREAGVRAEHFGVPEHQALFAAVAATIARDGAPHDETLVHAALAGDARVSDPQLVVRSLWETDSDPRNAVAFAERVVELAGRRADREAGRMLMAAADSDGRDVRERQRSEAVSMLARPAARTVEMSPQAAVEDFIDRSNQREPERFALPWVAVNRRMRGGIARKQRLIIGGWSGHAKSAALDEIMWSFSGRRGLRTAVYLTEMSIEERVDRNIARIARVEYGRVDDQTYQSDPREAWEVMAAVREWSTRGFTFVQAAGWRAEEIAEHALLHGWDAFAVDVLHEIAHRDERDLAHITSTIGAAAVQANAALVMAVHLNDARNVGAAKPEPVARDIRGTGMIYRGADHCLFFHRHEDEHGIAGREGVIKLDKVRKAAPMRCSATYQGEYMQWRVTDPLAVAA